jgi:hypothetical protein
MDVATLKAVTNSQRPSPSKSTTAVAFGARARTSSASCQRREPSRAKTAVRPIQCSPRRTNSTAPSPSTSRTTMRPTSSLRANRTVCVGANDSPSRTA